MHNGQSLGSCLVQLQSAGGARLAKTAAGSAPESGAKPAEQFAAAFETHAGELLKNQRSVGDPKSFAQHFLKAAGAYADLVRVAGPAGTGKVQDCLNELRTAMETLRDDPELLRKFTVADLTGMAKAAQALGIDLNENEALDDHFSERQRESRAEGGRLMAELSRHIADDNPAGAMKALKDLRQLHADYARMADHIEPSAAPAGGRPALSKNLLQFSLESMEDRDDGISADVLLKSLDQNNWSALANRLESAGKALSSRPGALDREMGAAMTADADLLERLHAWANDEADEVAPIPDAQRSSIHHLDAPTRQALQDRYGMVPNTDGSPMSGRAAPALQAAAGGITGARVEAGLVNDPEAPHKLWFPQQQGVYYSITDKAGGKPRDLHAGWNGTHSSPDQRHALRLAATSDLIKLAGGDRSLMLEAARVAHPSSLAGIKAAMQGPASPLRLPDGTAGHFAGGREVFDFSFHKDDKGHLVVRCEYSVKDAQYFVPAKGGKPILLDRDASHAKVTVDVVLLPGGKSIALPAQLDYDADALTLDKALASSNEKRAYRDWLKASSGSTWLDPGGNKAATRSFDLLSALRGLVEKKGDDRIGPCDEALKLLESGRGLSIGDDERVEAQQALAEWGGEDYLPKKLPPEILDLLKKLEVSEADAFASYSRSAIPKDAS